MANGCPREDSIGIVPGGYPVRLQAIVQHHVVTAFSLPLGFALEGPRGPLRTAIWRKVMPLPRFSISLVGPEARSTDPPPDLKIVCPDLWLSRIPL